VPALLLDRDTRRLLPLALFALPGLLWIGFAFGYYGTIVPSTLFAKSGMSSFLDYVPRSAYFAFGTGFPANLGEAAVTAGGVALTLAKLSLAGLAIRRIGRSAPPLLYPIGVYPFVLVVAYGIIGAPAHYWEIQSASFFFHVAVVVGLLDLIQRIAHFVSASAHFVPASARRVASIATIALALFWIGANVRGTLEMLQGQQSWLWRGAKYELYRDVAEWANRELPRGTRIATSEVGVLGYFAEKFRIVDDAGLVSHVFGPGGDLGDAHYFRWQRPEYLLLLGDPRGRRVCGRAITPVHSFPFEASDFGLGLATLARIEPEPAP
jgi:hypothetical protein